MALDDPGFQVLGRPLQAERAGHRQQVAHQVLRPLVAVIPLLGHQLGDDRREFRRHLGIEGTNVGRRLLLVLDQLLEHGPARERRPAGQHVEQGASQRVQVAANVHVARVSGLLGTDVVEGPQRHPTLRQPAVAPAFEPPRQSHVDQLGSALRRQDDIRWLDVSMDDASPRCVYECIGDLKCDVDGFGGRQGPGGVHPLSNGLALDVFEGDIMEDAIVADAEDARDVLVIELGGGAAFLVESLDDFRVRGLVGGEQLEGDLAVELGVEGAEDRPHPADADGLVEAERVDHLAGARQGHRGGARGSTGRLSPRRAAGALEHGRGVVRISDLARGLATRAGLGGVGDLGGASGLGAQHRLMLNGSGVFPWQHILAKLWIGTGSEMSREKTGACNPDGSPKDYRENAGHCQRQLRGEPT